MLSSKLAEASLGISSPVPLQACWDCGVLIQSPGPQLQLLSDSPTAVGCVVSPTPVTLFGNSIFVDGNQVKLSHIGLGVLCTMTGVLIKEKRGDRDTWGELHGMMKAETGEMRLTLPCPGWHLASPLPLSPSACTPQLRFCIRHVNLVAFWTSP